MKEIQIQQPKKQKCSAKQKKIVLRSVLILLAIIIILIIVKVCTQLSGSKMYYDYLDAVDEQLPSYSYVWDVDYDENIMEDKTYLKQNRKILYSDGVQSALFDPQDDLSGENKFVRFFQTYYNNVVSGDYEAYAKLFREEYFQDEANLDVPEKFTMQRMYDMQVTKVTASASGNQEITRFKVLYRIQCNNGSFNNHVKSEEAMVLYFDLVSENNVVTIRSIKPQVELNEH